jgi:ATP-dependent DNA ligase
MPGKQHIKASNTNPSSSGQKRVAVSFIKPMRCKAVTRLPEDENWGFEIKFDGYRCIATKQGLDVSGTTAKKDF